MLFTVLVTGHGTTIFCYLLYPQLGMNYRVSLLDVPVPGCDTVVLCCLLCLLLDVI